MQTDSTTLFPSHHLNAQDLRSWRHARCNCTITTIAMTGVNLPVINATKDRIGPLSTAIAPLSSTCCFMRYRTDKIVLQLPKKALLMCLLRMPSQQQIELSHIADMLLQSSLSLYQTSASSLILQCICAGSQRRI